MPALWRKRSKARTNGGPAVTDDKKSRRRSLRDVFKPSESRERELLALKLTDSTPCEQEDIVRTKSDASPAPPETADFVLDKQKQPSTELETHAEEPATSLPEHEEEEPPISAEEHDEHPTQERLHDQSWEDRLLSIMSGAPEYKLAGGFLSPWRVYEEGTTHRDFLLPSHDMYRLATVSTAEDDQDHPIPASAGVQASEVPCMLTAHGTQRGTVGLGYLLQITSADSRRDAAVAPDADVESAMEHNRELVTDPEMLGLRKLDLRAVVTRLADLSDIAQDLQQPKKSLNFWERQRPRLLQPELFHTFITRSESSTSTEDETGLRLQCESLLHVLSRNGIWNDFSKVENRILLGQLLFEPSESQLENDASDAAASPGPSDRDMLLLQLMLACELLLRLDMTSASEKLGAKKLEYLTEADLRTIHQRETTKTKWDLIAARVLLNNVRITAQTRKVEKRSTFQKARRFFFPASYGTPEPLEYIDEPDIVVTPKHQETQLDGLKHFAQTIGWSDIEDLESTLESKFAPPPERKKSFATLRRASVYVTPAPPTTAGERTEEGDYFSSRPRPSPSKRASRPVLRPQMSRGRTVQRSFVLQATTPFATPLPWPANQPPSPGPQQQPTGWLSRAYLTGLILPGESLQHHLISAVLENSPDAMSRLGDTATLFGGFAHNRRSYWSKQCIVGRVLACMKSSQEGWGWVGTTCSPSLRWPWGGDGGWRGEGWIDVDVEDVLGDTEADPRNTVDNGKMFRLQSESAVKPTSAIETLEATHFTLPVDAAKTPSSLLWFDGLHLERMAEDAQLVADTAPDEPPAPATCTASLAFSSASISSEIGSPRVGLAYDVYFVSAARCEPPSVDDLVQLWPDTSTKDALQPVHPLHVSQRYRVVSAAEALKKNFVYETRRSKLPHDNDTEPTEVLVLDARGSETLELLARSWCASKGEHAIVGKQGETCLACCIREARGAGISVVIRIA